MTLAQRNGCRGNRTAYDKLNRVVLVEDAESNDTASVYDANGNRTVLVDGVGNRTTWTYDLLNRVVAEQDVGGTATFAYDGAGQLASTTDKLGRRRDFDYDLAGRKESEVWFTSGATVQLQTWTYDLAGRMTAARDPDGTYTYTYDRAGRVTQAQGPFGVTLTYAYDTAGNRTGVTDSTGVVTTVAFDAKNRQSSEAAAGGGSAATRFDYSYTDRGQVSAVKRYSDLAGTATVALSAYSYDDAMRLTALTHTSGAGATLAHFTYAYDAADRLTGKTDNGTYTSYAYDDARQLTRDGAATFGYDAAGNRTNAGYATGAGNRISTDGVWTYTHDAEGNVTKRSKGASSDTWVYAYDHKNQLLTAAFSLTDGGAATQRVTYAYDASGSRIQRQGWDGTTTTTERYALDGGDPAKPRALGNEYKDAVLVLDGTNAVVTRWAFGTGFAEAVAGQSAAGAVTWDLTDRQGSVRVWINNSATTLATASFDGYGKLLTGGTIYDGIGYAGQRRDNITLLYSNGHGTRELLVDSGVWMQSDPRWPLTGEANPFMYVRNSPTNATDPSGMTLYVADYLAREWQKFAYENPGIAVEPTRKASGEYDYPTYQIIVGPGARNPGYYNAVAKFLEGQGYSAEQRGAALNAMYEGGITVPHPGYSHVSDRVLGTGTVAATAGTAGFQRSGELDILQTRIDYAMLVGGALTYNASGTFTSRSSYIDPRTGTLANSERLMSPEQVRQAINQLAWLAIESEQTKLRQPSAIQTADKQLIIPPNTKYVANIGKQNEDKDRERRGREELGASVEFAIDFFTLKGLLRAGAGFGKRLLFGRAEAALVQSGKAIPPVGKAGTTAGEVLEDLAVVGAKNKVPQGAAAFVHPVNTSSKQVMSIEEVLANGTRPGTLGITLSDDTIRFTDLWKLTQSNKSAEGAVEWALTIEKRNDKWVYRLYNGGTNWVARPSNARLIAHTHPSGTRLPSTADTNNIDAFAANHPSKTGRAPHARIIWGPGEKDFTLYSAEGVWLPSHLPKSAIDQNRLVLPPDIAP